MLRTSLKRALPLGLLLSSAFASGCSTYIVEETGDDGATANATSASASDGSSDGSDGWDSSAGGTSGGSSDSASGGDSGDPGGTGTSGETGGDSAGDTDTGDTDTGEPEPEPDPGQLTAGEWRDLDHWDFWLGLLNDPNWQAMEDMWRFYTSQRYAVVVEADGAHVNDAQVALLAGQETIWEARTDVDGRAELFAGLFGADVEGPLSISVNGVAMVDEAAPAAADPIVIQLDPVDPPAQVLDLLFMIDTTGSMGDELQYLQAELADVIDEIQTLVGQSFKLRLSVNFYRDEGDAYVVRPFPFTENIPEALDTLAAQDWGGGGDYPEAVTQALDSAIADHQWSDSAVARLTFLVLDAPPHNTPDNVGSMNVRVKEAAAKGIRIIPVASSGVDKDTEFFLRFIDIATGGTYVFLTNDSGIGGDHIEPTIGDYQVEFLNDLLVRLIAESVGVK
ncbi:MAG: VWA domain-containing protein [Myxococcales bacterium]|nr:VWA domain-containing protein [Myxococcales bacterium]